MLSRAARLVLCEGWVAGLRRALCSRSGRARHRNRRKYWCLVVFAVFARGLEQILQILCILGGICSICARKYCKYRSDGLLYLQYLRN